MDIFIILTEERLNKTIKTVNVTMFYLVFTKKLFKMILILK